MTDMTDKQKDILKETVTRLRKGIRVTKVTCTRSVKGKRGDSYVGFSAAWHSTQDDAGGATEDQISTMEDGEVQAGHANGLSLTEAKLVGYLVAREVDLQAHAHARAGGNITDQEYEQAKAAIATNYSLLVREEMKRAGMFDGSEDE